MGLDKIDIRGARTHNLQNLHVTLPRDKLIVITGLSGSGKSSLAFDTLYAEGQRRYVESLSAYARQFLSLMEKPDVDHIEGLSPAIAIEQKTTSHNPRSTVGTVTELYDYLRLLFARAGEPRCPEHNLTLEAQTTRQIIDQILQYPENSKLLLLAPLVRDKKGEHTALFSLLRNQGFLRVRINNTIYTLEDLPTLEPRKKHTIEVVIDRIRIRDDIRVRLADSIETAVKLSNGLIVIVPEKGAEQLFSTRFACSACGYNLSELEPRLFSFNNPAGACIDCDGLGMMTTETSETECRTCSGTRLNIAARSVFIGNKNLPEICSFSIEDCMFFLKKLKLKGARAQIADKILKEITLRLQFLIDVGLDYLSLHRTAETLSGGEAQRIRLASQIGAGLVGVMYILDEPSIGLHQRDNERLLKTLKYLRDIGNTVIVVEHDEDAILAADHVLDIGPGAGIHGGKIIAEGTPSMIKRCKESLTGQYLSGKKSILIPKARTPIDTKKTIRLTGATGNNLKNLTVEFPVGLFTCVTGVSGSGKSTLINDTLYPLAAEKLNHADLNWHAPYKQLTGLQHLDKVVYIDQSPIGRTPRSNAATYTGLFTPIREIFAGTQEARSRGYTLSRFSFNVKGGRCETCQGDGLIKVEMHFLADMYVTCDTCHGKRYNDETLQILYKGKNIYEILSMTVEDGLTFFAAIPTIARKLKTLADVGLTYIQLGQSATTLSGGEAQRVKLSQALSKRDSGNTLYILDEPTTGLHFHDVKQLLDILHKLKSHGNTIIVIEHNLDVIKTADWVIDLGPEGGIKGGELLIAGTPETVASYAKSYTGRFLKPILNK